MSGHSKWSTIKHKKAATDAKKGKIFTKMARLIEVAAKSGADPETNYKLKLAIEKAKESNMPKENIKRAIDKGSGASMGSNYEEILYEAIAPNNVAILINVLTDNRNRAASEIRGVFSKHGGNLGSSGSVSWMFENLGVITIDFKKLNNEKKEELELLAIDLGAKDIKQDEDEVQIFTNSKELYKIKESLESAGFEVLRAESLFDPKNTVKIEDEESAKKILKIIDLLEELDDVESVSANFDISTQILEKIT